MNHYSSTFFISRDFPLRPIFHSMTTPCLTLKSSSSSIALHFDSFEEIKNFSDELRSLLSLQNEKFSVTDCGINQTINDGEC
jgi:hypothetical protein